MKKLDRLRSIEEIFGEQCVLPYFDCRTWQDVEAAADHFDALGLGWNIRTDFVGGETQGYNLPFLYCPSRGEAKALVDREEGVLLFIVHENLPRNRLNGHALRIDHEHIFVEYDQDHPTGTVREMMNGGSESLRHVAVGPSSYVLYADQFYRSYHPEQVRSLRFDRVYNGMMMHRLKSVEFTVAEDNRLIVW